MQKYESRAPRVLILGMESAGKTAFLFREKLGRIVPTTPTDCFNHELIPMTEYSPLIPQRQLSFWDVGGSSRAMRFWPHFAEDTSCVLFMINPFGPEEQYSAAIQRLQDVLERLPRHIPVIFVHAKQDLSGGMPDGPRFMVHDDVPDLGPGRSVTRFFCSLTRMGANDGVGDLWKQIERDVIKAVALESAPHVNAKL